MPASPLFNILNSVWDGSPAEQAAALVAAIAYLLSLLLPDTGSQLMYQGEFGRTVLHLLALRGFSACEQAAPFLSLIIERGRESCGTTTLMSLTDILGATPLHFFARCCSDFSLTKVVLREYPPSLAVLDNDGETPLNFAVSPYGITSECADFLRAATAAYNSSNLVALEALCGGSSPYLSSAIHWQKNSLRAAVAICLNRQEEVPSALSILTRTIRRQATAFRAAIAISLNRQEEAPSAMDSVEAAVALSLLGRLRDFGRVGNSSDLLRVVLSFVGP